MISHPFLSQIKEKLGLVGVEVIGNVDRTAEVVSELVVVNRSGDEGGAGRRVALPGIGIEDGVADIFVGRAVKGLRAALGGDANLPAGGAAIFRSVVRSENLNFLRRIHIGSANAGAVGARAHRRERRHR